MQIPLQVSFHQLDRSEALEGLIKEKALMIEKQFPRITSMRVLIELATHRHHKGNLYHVRIDLTLPGAEIVVGRNHSDEHAHEDPYTAVRDSFKAAKRQLDDFVQIHFKKKRGDREFLIETEPKPAANDSMGPSS